MADKKSAGGAGNTEKKPVYETQESLYQKAMAKLAADDLIVQPAYKISNYKTAAAMFAEVGDYLDAPEKAAWCNEAAGKAQELAREAKYHAAAYRMEMAQTAGEWEHLAKEFEQLKDYRDAAQKATLCRDREHKLERKQKSVMSCVLAVLAALIVAAGAAHYTGFFRYVKGRFWLQAGSYETAGQLFEGMPGFLDSDRLAEKCLLLKLRKTKIGADVSFGTCKWKILDREKGQVRLIASDIGSEHLFHAAAFHKTREAVSWETSSLREWLNTEVLETIFTDAQREMLVLQESGPSENALYGTSYPQKTQDYLTLLSAEEIESGKYAQGIGELGHDYWLRTPGNAMDCVAYMNSDHVIRAYGVPADDADMMVRPVILVRYGTETD